MKLSWDYSVRDFQRIAPGQIALCEKIDAQAEILEVLNKTLLLSLGISLSPLYFLQNREEKGPTLFELIPARDLDLASRTN